MGEGGRIGCRGAFLLALARFARDVRVLPFLVRDAPDREVLRFVDPFFRAAFRLVFRVVLLDFLADLLRVAFFLPLEAFFEVFFRADLPFRADFPPLRARLDFVFLEGFPFVDRFVVFLRERAPFVDFLVRFRVAFLAALRVAFLLTAIATLPREGQGGEARGRRNRAFRPG